MAVAEGLVPFLPSPTVEKGQDGAYALVDRALVLGGGILAAAKTGLLGKFLKPLMLGVVVMLVLDILMG